jgi:hypothetical protein
MTVKDIFDFVSTYYIEGSDEVYKKYSNFLTITIKENT